MADDDNAPLPIAAGGLVSVVSPGGTAGTVPEKDLAAAIAMGYRLEAPGEHAERRLEQEYGNSPVSAAALGAASSVTFGGSDVILNQFTKEDSGESPTAEISRRNKGARLVGEIGGLATGVGAAGLISGAGKATRAAAGAGFRGAAAAGAAEGGLIGVQQTVAGASLAKDPLSAEAVAGDLVKNVLFGSALGGAGGALGELVSRGAGKARASIDALGDNLAARAAAPGERKVVTELRKIEVEKLEAALVPERAAMVDELTALRVDQKPLREALKGRIASAPETVRKDMLSAERSLGSLVGNPNKFTKNPEAALDAVVAYEQHLTAAVGADPPKLAADMIERVGAIRQRLERVAAGPTSAKLAELDTRLAALAKPVAKSDSSIGGMVAAEAANQAMGAVTGALGAAVPGLGMITFLAGKLGGKASSAIGGAVTTRVLEIGGRIAHAAAKVAGVVEKGAPSAFARGAALAPAAFDTIRDAALEAAADPQALRARVDMQLDGVRLHDPDLADQLAEVLMRGPLHLAAIAPKSPGGPTLTDQSGPVSRLEKDRFLRRAEVVMDPNALLDAINDGTLTPSMVQTADAVHIEVMKMLRSRILAQLNSGPDLSHNKRLALTILLGAPASPSMRPEQIAAAQARITADMNAAARQPPPQSGAVPREPDTTGQRYSTR